MYENEVYMKQLAAANHQVGLVGAGCIQPPTIRENIDRQIEKHLAAVRRLEETKVNLEKANLLDMKISDLQQAMSY